LNHLQDLTPREFAPMNINWGLFPDSEELIRDKALRRAFKLQQASDDLTIWLNSLQNRGLMKEAIPTAIGS